MFSQQTIVLKNTNGNRTYFVDLYLPQINDTDLASMPVAVILAGVERTNFSEIGVDT